MQLSLYFFALFGSATIAIPTEIAQTPKIPGDLIPRGGALCFHDYATCEKQVGNACTKHNCICTGEGAVSRTEVYSLAEKVTDSERLCNEGACCSAA